jgi:mono/diheme cytochrome c family protein
MKRILHQPIALTWAVSLMFLVTLTTAALRAAPQAPAAVARSNALPAVRTGAEIYEAACATCHGRDGKGAPRSIVVFDAIPRDLTDCTATAEPTPDWVAVVTEGGPVRALGRQMPAFGDALTAETSESRRLHPHVCFSSGCWETSISHASSLRRRFGKRSPVEYHRGHRRRRRGEQ